MSKVTRHWDKLDGIMRQYAPKLRDDLRIEAPLTDALASTIASEVGALPSDLLRRIASDDLVGLSHRIDELTAFEQFMDFGALFQAGAAWGPLTRAQVVSQLYIVFVYLGDACFTRLRKLACEGSVLKKCCGYLNDFSFGVFVTQWRMQTGAIQTISPGLVSITTRT